MTEILFDRIAPVKINGVILRNVGEAEDDVWSGDSSNDKVTGEASRTSRCSRNENAEVLPGSDKEGQVYE